MNLVNTNQILGELRTRPRNFVISCPFVSVVAAFVREKNQTQPTRRRDSIPNLQTSTKILPPHTHTHTHTHTQQTTLRVWSLNIFFGLLESVDANKPPIERFRISHSLPLT